VLLRHVIQRLNYCRNNKYGLALEGEKRTKDLRRAGSSSLSAERSMTHCIANFNWSTNWLRLQNLLKIRSHETDYEATRGIEGLHRSPSLARNCDDVCSVYMYAFTDLSLIRMEHLILPGLVESECQHVGPSIDVRFRASFGSDGPMCTVYVHIYILYNKRDT